MEGFSFAQMSVMAVKTASTTMITVITAETFLIFGPSIFPTDQVKPR